MKTLESIQYCGLLKKKFSHTIIESSCKHTPEQRFSRVDQIRVNINYTLTFIEQLAYQFIAESMWICVCMCLGLLYFSHCIRIRLISD